MAEVHRLARIRHHETVVCSTGTEAEALAWLNSTTITQRALLHDDAGAWTPTGAEVCGDHVGPTRTHYVFHWR